MTCPYCMSGMYQQGLSGYVPDPLQYFGLGGYAISQQQAMAMGAAQADEYSRYIAMLQQGHPKTKLQLAQEYATEVRKRKPHMQIVRQT